MKQQIMKKIQQANVALEAWKDKELSISKKIEAFERQLRNDEISFNKKIQALRAKKADVNPLDLIGSGQAHVDLINGIGRV